MDKKRYSLAYRVHRNQTTYKVGYFIRFCITVFDLLFLKQWKLTFSGLILNFNLGVDNFLTLQEEITNIQDDNNFKIRPETCVNMEEL